MKTTTLRLRRIRFKDGRTLDVLRPKAKEADKMHAIYAKHGAECVSDFGPNLSGISLVTWGKDGSSTCMLLSDGQIPGILVPDFVRNRLLAKKIEDWTIDTVNGE